MNKDQLFLLYEKLYFNELDRREKLSSRLNIPLAILVAIIGFMSFMLKNAPRDIETIWHTVFWIFFIATCIAIVVGAWFFKSSWFGHTDKLLPTANETENYRETLIELYEEYEEKDALVETVLKEYLYNYYKQFSSENTTNNDARAYHLYRATYAITVAVLFAFISFIPYFLDNHARTSLNDQTITTSSTASSTASSAKR